MLSIEIYTDELIVDDNEIDNSNEAKLINEFLFQE